MSDAKKMLNLFDVVNLVVGTIIGADIYIAAAFGAGLLGPASLIAWILAGLMAIIIALSFAECSSLVPRVGGPYAYAKDAFGDFVGFLSGWSLIIAEWSAIAVFPLAFVAYIKYFFPGIPFVVQTIIKILFIIILTGVNYIGVKKAGRVNDILTILKLAPIFILTIIGIVYFFIKPSVFISNFTPIAPLGFGGLGAAIVLIFWAYVGFELVTVPSDEIIDSQRTIPRAIGLGMGIVTLFYVITNFVIVGVVPWPQLSHSSAPLALTGYALLGGFGAIFITIGALLSISGSDEAGILSSSRIPYAMAGDGLLPKIFAEKHPKYETPYMALIIQGVITGLAAILGTISGLIILSVFTLLFSYILTCMSVFPLRRKYGKGTRIPWVIPVLGVIISLYIMSQSNLTQIITGLILIALGIPIYWKYSPKKEIKSVIMEITSREVFLRRWIRAREVFLGYLLRRLINLIRRVRG
jgi:APA family basic amino acid/polyamine antiporter